jgi:carbon-monoxide dehydrogenase large subunit
MNDVRSEGHDTRTRRVEDARILRGLGRYSDDVAAPNRAFVAFVRSPQAFARIAAVNTAEAKRAPGVLAVITAQDLTAAGVGPLGAHQPMPGRGGKTIGHTLCPVLAADRVLHAGQPIAAVVAETLAQAQDAAELVAIDFEELTPVTDLREAIKPGAPQLWPEAPGNVVLDWPGPVPDPDGSNARAVDDALAGAATVARVSVVNQRLVVASMEPRGASASYDASSDSYTLRACSQGAGSLRDAVASVSGLKNEQLRVITEEVGGAFGMKTPIYPEYPVLLVAARQTRRPVHWMSTRSEAFLTDFQARDTITEAELGLDASGKFVALRIRHLANMGAFLSGVGAFIQTGNFSRCFPGMYLIPRVSIEVKCVLTNTVPTAPYRGAGRPEANYVIERVVEEAARVSGIDRVKLRRKNLIPKKAMPYKTAVGTVFDTGDFAPILDKALALAGYGEFKARRREAAKRKVYRGIGVSCFLEHAGGMPTEGALVTFPGDDKVVVALGLHSTGQSHATVFARLAAQQLGIAPERVRLEQGDSRFEIKGITSVASRSAMAVSHAIVDVVQKVVAKGRAVAANLMEAAEGDIVYRSGAFEVTGTDRRLTLFEVAAKAKEMAARGEIKESLDTKTAVDTPPTYPNGCHIAEVEVDPNTGVVSVVGYSAVDDCGTVLDHTIVSGQVHGGLAQGLGQVLMENAVYDASGQLVSGSFMDYAMPRAEDMPPIKDDLHPVPATTNPLGVKGVGEAATTASLAAIMNAIADAIPGGAGAKLDMPATPEKVWQACRAGAAAR